MAAPQTGGFWLGEVGSGGMKFKRYQLYVQIDDVWQWAAGFDASDHAHAFQQAMTHLKPEHYTFPIRLEQTAAPRIPKKNGRKKPR